MKPAYRSLALQTIVSGLIMYLVMFVMIDRLSSLYNNLNMVYTTLMMVAPVVVLMIVAMPGMFPSKRLAEQVGEEPDSRFAPTMSLYRVVLSRLDDIASGSISGAYLINVLSSETSAFYPYAPKSCPSLTGQNAPVLPLDLSVSCSPPFKVRSSK